MIFFLLTVLMSTTRHIEFYPAKVAGIVNAVESRFSRPTWRTTRAQNLTLSRSDIIYENLTQISLPYIQDGRSAVYDTEEKKKNRVSVSIILFPVKPQPVGSYLLTKIGLCTGV